MERGMDMWVWQPLAFLEAILDQWVALMTGGALILAVSVIERLQKHPVPIKAYVLLCVLALFVACFFAWRQQYTKNTGTIAVQFYLPHPNSVINHDIEEQIIMINTSAHTAVIREVGLGRVYLVDQSEYLNDPVGPHCKEMEVSPQHANRTAEMGMSKVFKLKSGALFSYLTTAQIAENKSLPLSIESGKTQILRVTFHGNSVDPSEFNAVAVCPAIVYLQKDGTTAAALCEGSTRSVIFGNKPPITTGPDTLRFEIFRRLRRHTVDQFFREVLN
jgi:hypothetical protein